MLDINMILVNHAAGMGCWAFPLDVSYVITEGAVRSELLGIGTASCSGMSYLGGAIGGASWPSSSIRDSGSGRAMT
jgi:hypothetical protein